MGQGMQLHPMRVLPQRLPVINLIDYPPLQLAEAHHRAAHGCMQRRIGEGALGVADEVDPLIHWIIVKPVFQRGALLSPASCVATVLPQCASNNYYRWRGRPPRPPTRWPRS